MRRPIAFVAALISVIIGYLSLASSAVHAADPPIAILVVGDQNAGVLTNREKELGRLLVAWRAKIHLSKNDLPLIAYHMNKDDERVYCEKTLGVTRKNLLFLGIVEHDKRVPQKVIYRINNVVDTNAAVEKVMGEVVTHLGLDPGILTASPSAAPSVAPSTAPSPTPNSNGVSLIKVVIVDYQGIEKNRFLTSDRGAYVNVLLHNDKPTVDQRHKLSVTCVGPEGKVYGRPIGGPFTVFNSERIDSIDMLRRSDPDRHNGFLIKGNAIEQKPGHYQVIVEVDGTKVGQAEFDVVSDR